MDTYKKNIIICELLDEFHLLDVIITMGEIMRIHNKEILALKNNNIYQLKEEDRNVLETGRNITNRLNRIIKDSKNGIRT